MSWNKSVFTTVGTGMMSEVLSGATMTITKAVGGSGTTEEASLAALTDVQEEKQTLKILGIEDAADSSGSDMGKRIKSRSRTVMWKRAISCIRSVYTQSWPTAMKRCSLSCRMTAALKSRPTPRTATS